MNKRSLSRLLFLAFYIPVVCLTEHVNLKAIGITFIRDIGNMSVVTPCMCLSHQNDRTANDSQQQYDDQQSAESRA